MSLHFVSYPTVKPSKAVSSEKRKAWYYLLVDLVLWWRDWTDAAEQAIVTSPLFATPCV
jgi:hypothetical protein